MIACVFTLGCKVNEVESAYIISAVRSLGWEVTDKLCPADAYILNTCAVTREAEKKSRQLIARVRKFSETAPIFVCGCSSQRDETPYYGRGAEFVCGAMDKREVIAAFCEKFGGQPDYGVYPAQNKTRAFIKVQDGCDNFCSYCIIPYLRGRERSRKAEDVLKEAEAADCPEIVLTGVNLSAYNDGGLKLDGLIKSLYGIKKRIRLGSLETEKVNDNLLNALKGLYDFAPQFHLSLQSGSTPVLRDMNRRYTAESFLEKCDKIYGMFPAAAITTDIIAGFPTETDEDFKQSVEIISRAGFARVHAFCYSPREGTAAYKLKDLPPKIKSARLAQIISAAAEAEKQYILRFSGKQLDFIAEEYDGEYTVGYTANYIRTYLPAQLQTGVKYNIIMGQPFKDGALAEIG